jgi:hypothetical protein
MNLATFQKNHTFLIDENLSKLNKTKHPKKGGKQRTKQENPSLNQTNPKKGHIKAHNSTIHSEMCILVTYQIHN